MAKYAQKSGSKLTLETVTLNEFKLNDLKQVDTLNLQSPSSSHKNNTANGQKFQISAEEPNALFIKHMISILK
jgi:hypothetical protein